MRRAGARALAALAVAGAAASPAAPALAQRSPDAATLDRADGISRIGLDAAWVSVDSPAMDAALRLELFGQYVAPSGLGFYGALPLARSVSDGGDETALGAIDVGMLYIIHRPTVSFAFRGGLGLPTAGDEPGELAVNLIATQARLGDFALVVPDALYGRLAFSPLIHTRGMFVRFDAGVDAPISEGDEVDAQSLLRLNLAVGADLGPVALSGELVNLIATEEIGGEDFLHTVALSARFMGEVLQPFIAVGLPLDDSTREVVDLFISAGLQVVVR
ncbi:MAG TPA: hypothetical protein VKZ63_13905 [Kofleriaceae bacterium]|nr:hypothetical protein [Kofleriaceae bacterium]